MSGDNSAAPVQVHLEMAKQHRRPSGIDLEEYFELKARGVAQQPPWLILKKELQLTSRLGDGAMGEVFEGEYKGKPVAVKTLHEQFEEGSQEYIDMIQEVNIISRNYKNPSQMHPNIIRFIGVCLQDKVPLLVMELMGGGTLNDMMNRKSVQSFNKRYRPPREDMLRWSTQLMQGVSHLHTAGIIHRDIKPHNLMLTADEKTLKLGDFGNSKSTKSSEQGDTQMMTGKTGTLRYMAPEVYLVVRHTYDEKVDIYSCAMIFWFLCTGSRVFDKMTDVMAAHSACVAAVRPPISALPYKDMRPIVESCWDHDPKQRPSSEELLEQLQQLKKPALCGLFRR